MKRIVYILLLFSFGSLFSQKTIEKEDLKVGLVLSGGGAKGFAHVAVIKVLEEAGVRVDYIGGTSMGAIIGGLYAAGYTAAQLDSIIRSLDFKTILSDKIPRKSKPFYEKENGEKYSLTLPIKNKSVGIPTALSEGQNVLNILTELTQTVNNISDFSKLPIPFVCVATDLKTGNPVILKSGFLPEAMRASGAFPTLLTPVVVDGKLLSDGGIVNNFPVEEVIAMGADIIIGVDIQSGLLEPEELDSFMIIIGQIVGFQMYKTLEYKYKLVDVLIKPNMRDFNVVSFAKINEIMKEGDSASRSKIDELKQIASKQIKSKTARTVQIHQKKFHISGFEIEGNRHYTDSYILGKLNLKKRDTTSYKSLIESVNNLYGTGNFEVVQYKILEEEHGSTVQLQVKEKKVSNFLKFSAHYDHLYKTGLLINLTSKHLLIKNDILSTDFVLGDNLRYYLNYFIDNGFHWSFGFKSGYNFFDVDVKNVIQNGNKLNLKYEDFSNQVYVQTVFNRKFAVGAGLAQERIKAYTKTISALDQTQVAINNEIFYFDKSNYLNLFSYIKLDTYDKKYFQKKGFYLDAGLKWHLLSTDYSDNFNPFSQIKGKIGFAHTFFNKMTLHAISEAGITLGDNMVSFLNYSVGGYGENYINNFIPFYGYGFSELQGDSFLRTVITARYEFFPKHYFSISGNYARVEKNVFDEGRLFENTKSGYKVSYGVDTFLGPIEVHYTWSPDHYENYWYLNVGYWF